MSWATDELKLMFRIADNQRDLGKAIAQNIAYYRQKKGLTQTELAKLTNKKQPDIARQERSNYARHTINSLNKIATALDVTVADLVAAPPQPEKSE